jgi:tRNA A37 methylthiotransferase MiaB
VAVEHESEKEDANIVVINTCGFIDNAKEESISAILEQAERKESREIDKLYVMGCLSERYKLDLERQPITYNLSISLDSFLSACSRIALIDSSFALSINPQVFITTIFASSFSDSCSTATLFADN